MDMDDINLIASLMTGLQTILEIAYKFYDINNTKINFNKQCWHMTSYDLHDLHDLS